MLKSAAGAAAGAMLAGYEPPRRPRGLRHLRSARPGGGGLPYSKPHGVTGVLNDHTSVLATIEAKWNLPAMTYRDANATTLMDFLDPGSPRLLHPPALAAPGDLPYSEAHCDTGDPKLTVLLAPRPGKRRRPRRKGQREFAHQRGMRRRGSGRRVRRPGGSRPSTS